MGIVIGEVGFGTLGMVGLIEIVLIGALYYVYSEWADLKKNYPELQVHQAAKRGSRPPVIEICDISGAKRQFSGVKEKPQDVSFKNKDYRVIFDPRLTNTLPKDHYSDNVPIYPYFTTLHFPVDTVGALAVSQCMDRVRKEYPELDFIRDDFTIMGLLATPAEDLQLDIPNIIKSYPITDNESNQIISDDKLADVLQEIQLKMTTWGMKSQFYSISDAIKAIPIGTTAADMQQIIQLAILQYANDNKKGDFDKYLPLYIVGGLVTIMVIAYMVTK